MEISSLAVAALSAVAVLVISIGISLASRGGNTLARLERYASTARGARTNETAKGEGLADMLAQSSAFASINKAVERQDFGANLLRELGAADLALKPSEYLAIWFGAIVGTPLIFLMVGFVVPSFRSPVALFVGLAVGFFLPRLWLGRRKSGRLNSFNKQLPDTITLIANALRAGSSFLQSVELVVREAGPPIATEFARVIREVNLGLPLDEALDNMVKRVRSDDLELMATAIAIQHQVGGNLAEILDSIAFTIRERVRIKGEIRSLTAQQRMSGYVVGGLPFGLSFFIFLSAPNFFTPMFEKPPEMLGLPLGVILIGLAAVLMGVGFTAINKIVDIEV